MLCVIVIKVIVSMKLLSIIFIVSGSKPFV